MEQTKEEHPPIRARFKPKNRKELHNNLEQFVSNDIFIWKYAFEIDSVKRYTTDNILFPAVGGPILETDLVEVE